MAKNTKAAVGVGGSRQECSFDQPAKHNRPTTETQAGLRHLASAPVTVVIAGEPVAKAGPRVTRRGIAYTPAHTRKYEAHGRLAAQLAMGDRPPIEVPVRLELVAELPIPGSWSGRRRALAITGDVLPTFRPDVDNFIKAGLGTAWLVRERSS
jgi:Holliday junction resolvase RusA-like endonuclease